MSSLYARWMYNWETRLTSVDKNRVVRPLEWGIEWSREWPCRNGFLPHQTQAERERYLLEYNARAVAASDEFFAHKTPPDFRLEKREVQVFSTREIPDPVLERKVRGTYAEFLRFTSPVRTPYPENNLVNARWFPAKGKSAVVLLPHWNSDALNYNSLCRILNWLGISVLRLSMPYHDIRRPFPPTSAAPWTPAARPCSTFAAVSIGYSSKATSGSESPAPAWVRAMHFWRLRTIRESKLPHSITLPPTSLTLSGTANLRATSGRGWRRNWILTACARCGSP